MHQPYGGAEGQATDIIVANRELQRIKEVTTKILSKHTGKDKDEILRDIERDYYMDAEEAMRYGIVDFVVEERN